MKISNFSFFIDFFIGKIVGLENFFSENYFFDRNFCRSKFSDENFLDHIFRVKKFQRFQKSYLENCVMRPCPPSRLCVYFPSKSSMDLSLLKKAYIYRSGDESPKTFHQLHRPAGPSSLDYSPACGAPTCTLAGAGTWHLCE